MRHLKNILIAAFAAASLTAGAQGRTSPDTLASPRSENKTARVASEMPVVFKDVRNTGAFVKKYPFLKSFVDDLAAEAAEAGDGAQSVSFTLRQSLQTPFGAKGPRVLFVRTEGALYAGSHGSPVDVYVDARDGKGFKPVLSVTTYDGLRLKTRTGTVIDILSPDGKGAFAVFKIDLKTGPTAPSP